MLLHCIDNYQGEESKIVIATLTRSNQRGDIGFMQAPERLNVLLSRARDALIVIGNSKTFLNARKGKEVWARLFAMLQENRNFYRGLPIRCERHPDKKAVLTSARDFETECPDGGCMLPW